MSEAYHCEKCGVELDAGYICEVCETIERRAAYARLKALGVPGSKFIRSLKKQTVSAVEVGRYDIFVLVNPGTSPGTYRRIEESGEYSDLIFYISREMLEDTTKWREL